MLDQLFDRFILRETKAWVLQDWEKSRKSEAGSMSGLVADTAAELGLDTPARQAIVQLARRVETGAMQPEPVNLDLLLELEAQYRAD